MKLTILGLLWLFLLEFTLLVMSLEPGFLDFDNLPDTNFSCVGKVIGGYYADLETNCQMFHVCTIGQLDEPMDIRFLCLNGTVFDQETRVCERIDEVDCSKSEQFYSLNLELYGNTQPPILEDSPEIDYSLDSKKSSSTISPTSTPAPSTFAPFFTTPITSTTNRDISKVITSHHFPVNSPDIRFNPEEINISLNSGSAPDISRSQIPISYQQQSFSEKNTRVTVTTHTTIYKNDKPNRVPLLSTTNHPVQTLVVEKVETTLTPKSVVSYGLTHNQGSQVATPTEINYGFQYPQTEETVEYHTEVPPHPYQYQLNIANFRPPTAEGHPYHSTFRASNKRPHKINFPATTYRNHPAFTPTTKTPSYQTHRTEKPPRMQLPLPLLPTLPPLAFSSPSPFSLGHHIETKRYTKDHQSPPRIIISASASVSDNNGRRLNYSLGTIGASHILGSSPASYDDYKEEDVISDPFYHDVPKLKHKRSVDNDVIRNDQEAEDLLRYLFNWYKRKEEQAKQISIPVTADDISQINDQLAPIDDIETSTVNDMIYERIFRKMLRESTSEKNQKKTEDEGDATTIKDDEDYAFTTISTTSEVSNLTSRQQSRRRNSSFRQNETLKNKNQHRETPSSSYLQLTAKSHTRRSGRISSSRTPTNKFDSENTKSEVTILENQSKIVRQNDDFQEFQSNVNVERNLDTTASPITTTTQQPQDEITATITFSDLQTIPTTFNPNGEVVDQNATETIVEDTTTAATLSTLPIQPVQEYDYENIYEDINYDASTTNPISDSLKTTNNFVDTTVAVTTESTDIFTAITEKTAFEIHSSETQAVSQKEWNKVINVVNNKNTNKETHKTIQISSNDNKNNDINLQKEFSVLNISDYVDDNYEPLTYQIDTPTQEEIETKNQTETTTNSITTGFVQNITETVQDDISSTETNLPSTFVTIQNIDLTTTATNTPTITTTNTETTLITESILTESTTLPSTVTTEDQTETNLPSTFTTPMTTVPLSITTETYLITDSTQPITMITTTTTHKPTTQKQRNKKDYLRHRFGSLTNRKRGRGQSKFKNDTLQVLNTAASNQTDASVRNSTINVEKQSISTSTKINTTEYRIRLKPTTTPTETKIETGDLTSEISLTDAPLLKSANPTKSKLTKLILSTTPLTKVVRVDIRKEVNSKRFAFNCFNKKIHHFYSDPRDCRLFHYCTLGYTKNQLVDMKFVCDLGTYYDEEKFICTKVKPSRCP
ncbi:hypothetical protein FQR65_LT09205 [Abscondita terminalis]|nr:hypothetical protein FQR65_LT09205 [Abscondita terminalis]